MPTMNELKQLQGLPLEIKIEKSKRRIMEWYEHFNGEVYISFSGGKDSTVLLDLVRSIYKDVPAVFCDTGLEYPEVKDFVKTFENVITIRPNISFKQVIETVGYPLFSKEIARCIDYAKKGSEWALKKLDGSYSEFSKRFMKYGYLVNAPFNISDNCCYIMKKQPFKKYEKLSTRKAFIGSMTDESFLRQSAWLQTGCNAFESNHQISKPLSFWTNNDILEYIYRNNLKIASVYGQVVKMDGFIITSGCDRTGCVFCGFGCHNEKPPNRFQRLKQTNPKLWLYCMNNLGMKEVLQYINVPIE